MWAKIDSSTSLQTVHVIEYYEDSTVIESASWQKHLNRSDYMRTLTVLNGIFYSKLDELQTQRLLLIQYKLIPKNTYGLIYLRH